MYDGNRSSGISYNAVAVQLLAPISMRTNHIRLLMITPQHTLCTLLEAILFKSERLGPLDLCLTMTYQNSQNGGRIEYRSAVNSSGYVC
jgi:hypothetical protein